ncbi:MAG TPA: dihydrolipoyl dehydrogenase, partial [Nitrospiria bacterium]|nr:dihydrolipoyl dehydrogenase [Nitrospiria bacterium]
MVIGGGSAGRYAAKAAARLGFKVGMVEHGPFGGLCILKGCMPTKALLRSSEIIGILRKSHNVGIFPGRWAGVDFPYIIRRKDRLIGEMADDALRGVLRYKEITLLKGRASFLSPAEVRVDGVVYRAPKFVIATGSTELIPDLEGLKETGYLVSDDLLEMKELPASMVIIGGGAEGVEFGQFLARLGVKMTLLQRSEQILSDEDSDISEAMADFLSRDGIRIKTGATLLRVGRRRGKKVVSYRIGSEHHEVVADEILLVTGRTGNVEGLDLFKAGVETYDLGVRVDAHLRTSNPRIYAAGDVTGILQVVNLATYQGEIAGNNAVSRKKIKADYRVIPRALFTDPEFARVGLSEREARESRLAFRVGKYRFDDLGKAIVTDRTEGFIKIIADPKKGEILGTTIIGPEASIIIHQAAIAMHFRSTLSQYAKISHIHPSLAE